MALFGLAIDSKQRSRDVVAILVDDVASNGYGKLRATIRKKKTDQPARIDAMIHIPDVVGAINGAATDQATEVRLWDYATLCGAPSEWMR